MSLHTFNFCLFYVSFSVVGLRLFYLAERPDNHIQKMLGLLGLLVTLGVFLLLNRTGP